MKRHYNTRLSRKVILECLEGIYPDHVTFEQLCYKLPVLNIDYINLTAMLFDLLDKGKVEQIVSGSGLDRLEEWRWKNNGSNRNSRT